VDAVRKRREAIMAGEMELRNPFCRASAPWTGATRGKLFNYS
jgi:hypothetical protein